MRKILSLVGPALAFALLAAPGTSFAGKSIVSMAHGTCIDVTNGNFVEGNPLQTWECVPGHQNQSFDVGPQVSAKNLCMNVFDNGGVGLGQCNPFKKWAFRGGRFVSGDGKCLVATGNGNGAKLVLAACSGSNQELWKATSSPLPGGPIISAADGRCLDVTEGKFEAGTRLQVWQCVPGGRNHSFEMKGSSIHAGGMCVDVKSGMLGGGAVVLAQCSASAATQKWTAKGGTLVSSSGKCMAIDGKPGNGTPVGLGDCSKPSFRFVGPSPAPNGSTVPMPTGEPKNPMATSVAISEMNAGMSAGNNGDLKGALEHITKAIDSGGFNAANMAKAHVKRGKVLMASDLAAADRELDQALKYWPNYGDALINKGRIAGLRNDIPAALALFDKAAQLNQDDFVDARIARGELLHENKRYDEALKAFDEAVVEDPDWARSWFDRGLTYAYMGNCRAAILDYDYAIARNGENPTYYKARGGCKKDLGDMAGATEDVKVYMQLGGT